MNAWTLVFACAGEVLNLQVTVTTVMVNHSQNKRSCAVSPFLRPGQLQRLRESLFNSELLFCRASNHTTCQCIWLYRWLEMGCETYMQHVSTPHSISSTFAKECIAPQLQMRTVELKGGHCLLCVTPMNMPNATGWFLKLSLANADSWAIQQLMDKKQLLYLEATDHIYVVGGPKYRSLRYQ